MSFLRQLQQSFLLEEIDPPIRLDSSKLVREIKKYPIIYDNNCRRDQAAIFKAWENICATMLPNFSSLVENDKVATRKRLRDRWSYMRSTFRRDVFNNNVDCHRYLNWIQEINFLIPILTRPPERPSSSKNSRRRAKYKFSSNKKNTQHKLTSIITTTSNTSVQSAAPITDNINESQTVVISTTESSISDIIISCDSSSSDESTSLEILSSKSTEITEEEKSRNDLMVETYMSAFNLESSSTSPIDPDQMFLLTLLQNYRLVRNEHKETLQHKFYTFLRD